MDKVGGGGGGALLAVALTSCNGVPFIDSFAAFMH